MSFSYKPYPTIKMQDLTAVDIATIREVKEKLKNALTDHILTCTKIGNTSWYVSGGCIGSLLRGEQPNDYDTYFTNEEAANSLTRLYKDDDSFKNYVKQIDEKYRDVSNLPDGRWITENAITLTTGVQLIIKHYGAPDTIRSTFDFVHCMPYYSSWDDKLYISPEQYYLNMDKKLKKNAGQEPQGWRVSKFLEKGWTWL
jgi:hypothetical protein